jgi:hypothetical protein
MKANVFLKLLTRLVGVGVVQNEDKKKLKAAKKATEKLNAYSDGVHAAGGKDATKMYYQLNAEADKAIRALPVYLRTRAMIELLG